MGVAVSDASSAGAARCCCCRRCCCCCCCSAPLRGVAGALEEVREDLTVLSAKLEELRETEVGNDEETSDDAEETSGDAEETSDDADVDEK